MLTGHYTKFRFLSPAILSFGENHRESKGSRVLFMRCGGWSFETGAKCADVQSACCPMSSQPLVSDPGVSWLLLASMKLSDSVVSSQVGQISDPS